MFDDRMNEELVWVQDDAGRFEVRDEHRDRARGFLHFVAHVAVVHYNRLVDRIGDRSSLAFRCGYPALSMSIAQ